MKKLYTFFMLTGLILLCSGRAMAQSVTIDDITYTLYGDSVHVTKFDSNSFAETVEVLSKVTIAEKTYPVKKIESLAFEGSYLKSIFISDGIMEIGARVFENCSMLTDIRIPNSVVSIGQGAFGGCSSLKSITLPENMNIIDFNLFFNCISLTTISIPKSITLIDDQAFCNCSALTSMIIPNEVTSIGERAFQGCI